VRAASTLESWLLRTGGSLLSGGGTRASLLVLIYHRVVRERDPLLPDEPDAATFAAHMDLLAAHFRPLSLSEAVARLARGDLPARAVCVTFDDGYANNCEVALPILRSRAIPATVFVAPGFLNGGRMFNDTIIEAVRCAGSRLDLHADGLGEFQLPDAAARVKAIDTIITRIKHVEPRARLDVADRIAAAAGGNLPTSLMMSDAQVRALHAAGIEIGAHTMSHPILTQIDLPTARDEIVSSKRVLEEMIDAPVKTFAYPNGRPVRDYGPTHVALAREAGFECAVSTAWGAATMRSDLLQIPRIAPWDRTPLGFGARMLRAYRQRSFAHADGTLTPSHAPG
jgi:peptidoglycan/xylan/chitin deacetylase (PgdA/CDA1 family)